MIAILCAGLGLAAVWTVGGELCAPANCHVVKPANLAVENVTFTNSIQTILRGWLVRGQAGKGVVILMHGVRANRSQMTIRAQFLSQAGFSVLLFDFQAHGESGGKHITFGHLESLDAIAAVEFVRSQFPQEKIGVIGISLGGAAALLAEPPLVVDAMVIESAYPTIEQAVQDRMRDRLGSVGVLLAPLLLCQLHPRLGIRTDELHPIEKAKSVKAPTFFIAGTADRLTTIEESRALFAAAAEPKEFWEVSGATHEDIHHFTRADYERRVLGFLQPHLAR